MLTGVLGAEGSAGFRASEGRWLVCLREKSALEDATLEKVGQPLREQPEHRLFLYSS